VIGTLGTPAKAERFQKRGARPSERCIRLSGASALWHVRARTQGNHARGDVAAESAEYHSRDPIRSHFDEWCFDLPIPLRSARVPVYHRRMIKFLVSIELNGVRDYLPLHEAMSSRKFKRIIKCGDGRTFTLPTGQYQYRGDASIEAVMKSARKAAAAINYDDASILVCQIQGVSRFSKLKEAAIT
jgi:hypothetical protein